MKFNKICYKNFCNLNTKQYYDVLGVPQTASKEEIKKAYYKLAKLYHPDSDHSKKFENKFKEVTNAYEILSSSQNNKFYNDYKSHSQNYTYHRPNNTRKTENDYRYSDKYKYDYKSAYGGGQYYTNYNTNYKADQDQQSNEKFYIYRDPIAGRYYRVREEDVHNINSRRSYRRKASNNIYNDIYEGDTNEDEVRVEGRHLFAIVCVVTFTILFLINADQKNKAWHKNALVYKNQVYFPKNKDPIIEELAKEQGYQYPKELYEKRKPNM